MNTLKLAVNQLDAQIQEEARIANDYQKQYPDLSRTEALKLAAYKNFRASPDFEQVDGSDAGLPEFNHKLVT